MRLSLQTYTYLYSATWCLSKKATNNICCFWWNNVGCLFAKKQFCLLNQSVARDHMIFCILATVTHYIMYDINFHQHRFTHIIIIMYLFILNARHFCSKEQVVKVIWHKAASPRQTDGSIVFARWRQCALPWQHIGATWRIRLNSCFLRPTQVHNPNDKSISSAVFAEADARSTKPRQRSKTSANWFCVDYVSFKNTLWIDSIALKICWF